MKLEFEDVFNMPHKVYIAQPSAEFARYTAFPAVMNSLWRPMQTMYPDPEVGLYPANLQNVHARKFLKTDCEWFWLVNDDQIYPAKTLGQLLMHNKDVIVPVCTEKQAPFRPLIYDAPGADGLHAQVYLKRWERGLRRIFSCGGGGMLVHRRVLEAIPDPWWDQRMIKNPEGEWQLMSEDLPFCEKVNAAGFELWCDLDIAPIHLGTHGVRPVMNGQTGEWMTEVSRGAGVIYAPAATNPSGIEALDRRIIVPPRR